MWKMPRRSRSAYPRTNTISGISANRNTELPNVADVLNFVAGSAATGGAGCSAGAGVDAGCPAPAVFGGAGSRDGGAVGSGRVDFGTGCSAPAGFGAGD